MHHDRCPESNREHDRTRCPPPTCEFPFALLVVHLRCRSNLLPPLTSSYVLTPVASADSMLRGYYCVPYYPAHGGLLLTFEPCLVRWNYISGTRPKTDPDHSLSVGDDRTRFSGNPGLVRDAHKRRGHLPWLHDYGEVWFTSLHT